MKEIQAFQSDDGSFVGTYEQVLAYETDITAEKLYGLFSSCIDNYGEYYVNGGNYKDFLSFCKENIDFREFVKIVYNFKD